jgi:[amino group carrier protein]-L-2-aminoadipate 6-kinase
MDLIVVKVGGAAGVDAEAVSADVAALVAAGHAVVLVHGTSAAADALAERVGVQVRHLVSPTGHTSRYTDPEMLDLYVAAAAGQVNKSLVAGLQKLGCNAIGLSGVDGRLLQARRKSAIRAVENGRQRVVRDDYTGQLEMANAGLLRMLLTAGYTPVIAPLALGAEGECLNVDGDRAAALVAAAVGASRLVILSNVRGLLAAYPDESTLVAHVGLTQLDGAEAMAQGRMKKKVLAAREALAGGVQEVILADSRCSQPVQSALLGQGTVFGDAQKPVALPIPWAMSSRQSVQGI